jgi:threonine/homoserine efflux transporter RhtA
MESCNSLWFVPWGHEFDFYLAIERIPIGLAVTLEFIGPLLVCFGSKRFVDYLWVLLQQQELF